MANKALHEQFEADQTVDLYVMGRLSEAERADFEDHFMSCTECIEAVELAGAFQRDLKREAARDIERSIAASVMTGLLGARAMRVTSALLAAALLVLVFLPGSESGPDGMQAVRLTTLEVVRSDDPYAVNRIELEEGQPLVLTDQFVDPEYAQLRVVLYNPAREALMRKDIPGSRESVDLSLSNLDNGRYLLAIEGARGAGSFELISEYGFEIVSP